MNQTRLRPMIEGGLLAAIAIIFAVISAYLPIIGPFVDLLWPVPIILLGVRHNYKWSILATVVAGLIISILIHPLQAVTVVVELGLIGVVFGYAFSKNFSATKTMLWGGCASIISKAAILAIALAVTGINPFTVQGQLMGKTMEQMIEAYRTSGMSAEDFARMQELLPVAIEILKIIVPSLFALSAILSAFLNFFIAKKVLKKLGYSFEDFPPFKHWIIPGYSLYFFLLSLVMVYWGRKDEFSMFYNSGLQLCLLSGTLLFVQGLSLFNYLVDKYNLSRITRGIILLLMLVNGFLVLMLIGFGALDIFFDYRRLRTPRKSE